MRRRIDSWRRFNARRLRARVGRIKSRRQFGGKTSQILTCEILSGEAIGRTGTGARLWSMPGFFGCLRAIGPGRRNRRRLAGRLERPGVFQTGRGARWRLDAARLAGYFARAHGAHDIGFDHQVSGAADHEKVFDIVATDQHQAAASIDGGCIDHRQTRLAPPGANATQTVGAETAHQPGGRADQGQYDQERDEEARSQRHFRAEQGLEHLKGSVLPTDASRARIAQMVNSVRHNLPPGTLTEH